eukprot:3161006-Prymnesium_polylepis.1
MRRPKGSASRTSNVRVSALWQGRQVRMATVLQGLSNHFAVRLCILPNSAGGFAARRVMTREDICSSVRPRVSRDRNVEWSPSMRFRSLSDNPSANRRRSSFIEVIVSAYFGESFGSTSKNVRRGMLRMASHEAYILSVEFDFEPEFDSVIFPSADLERYNFFLASACE